MVTRMHRNDSHGSKGRKGEKGGLVDVVAYASIAFLFERDMNASVRRVLSRLSDALEATGTFLMPLDRQGAGGFWSPEPPAPGTEAARDALVAHSPWISDLSQGTVVVADAGMNADRRGILDAWGAESMIVAPVFVQGQWWGALGAWDASRRRLWPPIHRKLLLSLAGILSVALRADRQSVCIAESRRSLREARIQLDDFILASQDAVLLIEPDDFVSRWNKAADTLFGIGASSRPGRTYKDILPFSAPSISEMVTEARRGKAGHARSVNITGRMGCHTILASVFPLAGASGTVVVIAKDRTEVAIFRDKMERSLTATVAALASAVETRDPYTAGHQRRTAELARSISVVLGLSEDDVRGIHTAAVIHDIGKISVPSEILTCPRHLTEPELALIRMHCQAGYDIVKAIDFPWPVPQMILQHHERMDGSGYPLGLRGDAILIGSRIIGVADSVEAITNHRPYRPALGIDAARDVLERGAGIAFDKDVVVACLRVLDRDGWSGDGSTREGGAP